MNSVIDQRQLRPIDQALAAFLGRQFPQASAAHTQLAALVSHQIADGHLGLPLDNDQSYLRREARELLDEKSWQDFTAALPAVLTPEQNPLISRDGRTPLVLEDDYIYLHRYWQLQQNIARHVQQRLAQDYYQQHGITAAHIAAQLATLFNAPANHNEPDWQQIACVLTLRKGLGILTGGPGTGKTYTVVRLLALQQLLQQHIGQAPLNILLAAPTGKAADRLGQSIRQELNKLDASLRETLPQQATTLHRLLGTQRQSRHFRHHADNPLNADLVVVDEASMLDIDMMYALLDALPKHCRLILVGDKDQLASVEPGAVMQDFCHQTEQRPYSQPTLEFLQQLGFTLPATAASAESSALRDQTVMLQKSRRAEGAKWILELAQSINQAAPQNQQAQAARALFNQYAGHGLSGVHWQAQTGGQYHQQHNGWIKEHLFAGEYGIGQLLHAMHQGRSKLPAASDKATFAAALNQWAATLLQQLEQQQLLTPMRRGSVGVETLNAAIRHYVIRHYPQAHNATKPHIHDDFFAGEPLLITRNLYDLNVMNGDMGLVLDIPGQGLRVAFSKGQTDDGQPNIHWLLPEQLIGNCQGGYAITVHQSQGSGYKNTLLILPERTNPVLTKELLYTAVTRSSKNFTLIEHQGKAQIFENTAETPTDRHSRLFVKLHENS